MYAVLVVRSRTLFFQRRPVVTLNGIDPDDVSFVSGLRIVRRLHYIGRAFCASADTFLQRQPAAWPWRARVARVLGGYFEWCHSSPVLGTAIENRAVELAYGGALISEHA